MISIRYCKELPHNSMLKSQIVVWVEGSHLAHQIELTDKAVGLRPIS